jgi:hypothetical protein
MADLEHDDIKREDEQPRDGPEEDIGDEVWHLWNQQDTAVE